MSKLCVGLASDCDHPESDVQQFMQNNLPGAHTLPFAGFVTSDMEWVVGFFGGKSADEFDKILTEAENSPLLPARPDAVKKLEVALAQAQKGAEKGDWKAVFAAHKAASEVKGRSAVRETIAEIVVKAQAIAKSELAAAADTVKSGGDRAAVRAALKKLAGAFAGQPEQKDADAGAKAIEKLGVIEALAAEQQEIAREKARKDYAGTRWASLFGKQ